MKFRRGTAILTAMASALIMTGCSSEEAKTNENGDTVITIGRQTAPNSKLPEGTLTATTRILD